MGQGPSGMPGGDNINKKKDDKKKEKPKYEPPVESKFGKRKEGAPIQQLNYLVCTPTPDVN